MIFLQNNDIKYKLRCEMDNITEIVYGDSLCHWLKQSDFIGNNKIIKFEIF